MKPMNMRLSLSKRKTIERLSSIHCVHLFPTLTTIQS